jgi:Arc/MetJ-type ribon-helix-helix transcriptional regulator
MDLQISPAVESLISAQMATGNYRSHEELFRAALENLAAHDEEVRAIQESIELLEAGDEGVPLADAFESLRKKYALAADA